MSAHSKIQWTDRTCSRCRERKALDAFPSDLSRQLGVGYECHVCRNARQRAAYVPQPKRAQRRWLVAAREGDKKQARRRVNYLVEQGRIPHPGSVPCVDCGDVGSAGLRHEYDHARGYSVEHQMTVEAVCSHCHHKREIARRG